MKFARGEMIAAIDDAITRSRESYEESKLKHELKVQQQYDAWMAEQSPLWREYAAKIVQKLDDGKPITYRDMSTGGYANDPPDRIKPPEVYRGGTREVEPYAVPRTLREAKRLLELITDAEVTTNALKDAGFGQRALGDLVGLLTTYQRKLGVDA